jgi:hypothetical protein
MPDPRDTPGLLSVARAFVVQFDSHTDVARGQLAGRIEHVVSGQAALFHSLETLLAFVAQILQRPSGPQGDDAC